MTENYIEFTNPKLIAIYDAVNPIGTYADYYLKLAAELNAQKVIDLGCGTGLLSHELVQQGSEVVGVEPAPAMLEQARQKYGNEAEWIVGSSEALRSDMQADLLVMTGHVAQFFLEDDAWHQALQSMHQALKPNGYLAFESRNPNVQPFTEWPTKKQPSTIPDTPLGSTKWWSDNLVYDGGYATYDIHYLFDETGEELVSHNKLRFRNQEELTKSLEGAGFIVEQIYGNWDGGQLQPDSSEMIFTARKN